MTQPVLIDREEAAKVAEREETRMRSVTTRTEYANGRLEAAAEILFAIRTLPPYTTAPAQTCVKCGHSAGIGDMGQCQEFSPTVLGGRFPDRCLCQCEFPAPAPAAVQPSPTTDARERSFEDWLNREDSGDVEQLRRCWDAAAALSSTPSEPLRAWCEDCGSRKVVVVRKFDKAEDFLDAYNRQAESEQKGE